MVNLKIFDDVVSIDELVESLLGFNRNQGKLLSQESGTEEANCSVWKVMLPEPNELDYWVIEELLQVSNFWCLTNEVSDQLDEFLIFLGVAQCVLEYVFKTLFHCFIMK